ncbi:MAG: hypothetical protein M0Z53_13355 [Thermaerobacter sp.]|nr:hypothetical protein [Thermaerobacter sp.]
MTFPYPHKRQQISLIGLSLVLAACGASTTLPHTAPLPIYAVKNRNVMRYQQGHWMSLGDPNPSSMSQPFLTWHQGLYAYDAHQWYRYQTGSWHVVSHWPVSQLPARNLSNQSPNGMQWVLGSNGRAGCHLGSQPTAAHFYTRHGQAWQPLPLPAHIEGAASPAIANNGTIAITVESRCHWLTVVDTAAHHWITIPQPPHTSAENLLWSPHNHLFLVGLQHVYEYRHHHWVNLRPPLGSGLIDTAAFSPQDTLALGSRQLLLWHQGRWTIQALPAFLPALPGIPHTIEDITWRAPDQWVMATKHLGTLAAWQQGHWHTLSTAHAGFTQVVVPSQN